MNQAPYRDIYHLLNRALSGVTLERYIKSGWQNFYTARAEDTRRLENISDGLNNLERNAQDALAAQLIQRALKGNELRQSVLWLRHNHDPVLLSYLVRRVSLRFAQHGQLAVYSVQEFAGVTQQPFSHFLKQNHNDKKILAAAHRQRLALRHKLASNYDAAVQQLEPWLQSHGLLHQR